MNYFTIIMAICSSSKPSDREDAMDQLEALWRESREYDERMYCRAKHGVGTATNLPSGLGKKITIGGYRLNEGVKFN